MIFELVLVEIFVTSVVNNFGFLFFLMRLKYTLIGEEQVTLS